MKKRQGFDQNHGLSPLTKFQIFAQNHGLTDLEKCQFCGFLKQMFSLFRKTCWRYKTSKIVFSQFIFTIYYMGIQRVTRGDKGWQGVTRGYRGWQGVTKDYRNFFLPRTFPDTFSWSIGHKNQRRRNLKFLTKTMD